MVGKTVFELWLFGGNSNNGANCGLAYANSNNAWSNANANISARLTTLRKKSTGCRYCVMGNHPNTASLGSVHRVYSTCWSEQHSPCAGAVSRPDRDVSKSAQKYMSACGITYETHKRGCNVAEVGRFT